MPLNPYFLNLSENPRKGALQILADAGMDQVPVDLAKLAKKHDWQLIFEDFCDLVDKRRDGRFEIDEDKQVSIYVNTDGVEAKGDFSKDRVMYLRQRFTIAHETGHAHFETHKNKSLQDALNPQHNVHGRQYGYERESQANEFASELLMPQWHLEQQLKSFNYDQFFTGIEELTALYEISTLACAMRVAKEAPIPAMCLYFNSEGRLRQTPARSRFHKDTGFFIAAGERIPQRTLADDLANKPNCESWKRKQRDCKTWFPDSNCAGDYELEEQAIRLGRFGYLVWLSFEEKEIEY